MGKILVVDDTAFMRNTLSDILKKSGHNVVGVASDGNEAYVKYKELMPDIVTMDITMPTCDGIASVKKIKSDFPDAKIIMCSAMGQQPMVIDAIKSGARDFIVKPFTAERVIEAVNNAMGM